MPAKKITLANFKRFVNQHFGNAKAPLLISVCSHFDGMTDCVQPTADKEFSRALPKEWYSHETVVYVPTPRTCKYTLGVQGVWLVGQSHDYFSLYCENGFVGIRASNSCGSFIVAVKV